MSSKMEIGETRYIEDLEEIMKNMTLKEKCDFIAKQISLVNYKPTYDFKIENKII